MPKRRLPLSDLLFAAAFVSVGLAVWVQSRPQPITPLLARQSTAVDRAEAAKLDLPFLPPPSSPEEGSALLTQWEQFLRDTGPEQWSALRDAVAKRGKPETASAFDRLWSDYRAAEDGFRRALTALASPLPDQAGMQIRQTEDYMEKYNRFKEADDALSQWIVRLSPADFR